jgi:hypothetical protein
VEWLSSKPVELGPGRAQGAGGPTGQGSSGPTRSWDLAGPRGGEPSRAEQWFHGPMGEGLGGPAVLLTDHGLEKPSTI